MRKQKTKMCSFHKPKQLSYVAWHAWADKQIKQGKKQIRCKKCGLWFFEEEFGKEKQ